MGVDMYRQMRAACEQIGVKMISDDTCCRLLAAVYVYGDESAVYSEVMRRDIREAQERAGIMPGRVPNGVMVEMIAHYAGRLEAGDSGWLTPICERYGVTFPALGRRPDMADWKERVHGGLRVSPRVDGQTGQR